MSQFCVLHLSSGIYRKISKNWNPNFIILIVLKVDKFGFVIFHAEMCHKDKDGMANSVDLDQTAPLGAV